MRIFSKAGLKLAATVTLISIGTAFAQFSAPANARISALAGAHVSDISGVYRYPVMMTGYLDHIQANWGAAGQGFIGIKSVSEMFSFGVLANQGPIAPDLTIAGLNALNGYAWPADPDGFDGQVVIPHFLLGFDLGAVAIGADVFLEYAGYSVDNAGVSFGGSYSNFGARLSGRFDVAGANVMAKFGLGVPSINAEGLSGSAKLSFDNALYIEAGAEASAPIGGADWVLGLSYTRSDYRLKTGNTSDINAYASSRLNGYLGLEFNFVETAVATLGYSLTRDARTVKQPGASGDPSASDPIDYRHDIYAGVENAWEKAWIFDSFQLRGGAVYTVAATGSTASAAGNKTSVSQPARHSNVRPIVGVGASKAFATVDVALNPGEWVGLFTGPEVAAASLTVKF